MRILRQIFATLALAVLVAAPAAASSRKPLVIVSGQTKQLPSGDTLQTNASATGGASVNVPPGTAPTAPVDGDIWATTTSVFARINGATIDLGAGGGGGGGSGLLAANNLSDLANIATARSNLGVAIGTDVQAYDADLTALGGVTSAADKCPYFTGSGAASVFTCGAAGRTLVTNGYQTENFCVAVSDESTAITTGTAKITFRMPYAFTLTAVRASLNTVSSSGNPAFDLNEGGVSVFSTTLTIDASEKTSTTAATPAVISDAALADDAEMTVDIDTAGTGAKGAKLCLIGHQ
jgi:hypothetical protein